MGFLKLFKKKEVKSGEGIDIPPPPPLPDVPPLTEKKEKEKEEKRELPPLPPLEPIIIKHKEEHKPVEAPEPSFEPTPVHPKPTFGPPAPEHPEMKASRFPPLPAMEPAQPGRLFPKPHRAPPREEFKVPGFKGRPAAPKPMPRFKPLISPAKEREEKTEEITGPLFIKQDSYNAIAEGISIIKNKLKESEDLVLNLNSIKNNRDKEFEKWRTSLENIQRKLLYVDKTLYEQ